uniref:ABC transporter permease n=1 Tax=Thermosphaera aggregans TaxID=54254 RepID=A0A7C2G0U7_9CREN
MIRLVVLRRTRPLKYGRFTTIALSLIAGIVLYTLILAAIGVSPVLTLSIISTSFISSGVVKDFIVLTVLGYALLVAFKGSLWNIGAEGQFYMGAVPVIYLTTIAFFTMGNVSIVQSILVIIGSIILAIIFGGLWGAIAGAIKAYAGVDEVPVTLILNYIAYYLVNILILGPFQGKYVYGYKRTDLIPEAYQLGIKIQFASTGNPIIDGVLSYVRELIIHGWWLVGLALVVFLVWWFFNKTSLGLKVKVLGSNPDYLVTAGWDVKKVIIATFAISGAIVGFMSALYLLGYLLRLEYPIEGQTAGYGYLAILVAWLSLLDIALVPVSAYIISSLTNAGIAQSSAPEVKQALTQAGFAGAELSFRWVMIGSILLTYSVLRFLSDYEVRVIRK